MGPYHRVAVDLGIASWEGLWSRFEGCHPVLDGLAAWAPTYRRTGWEAALSELGADDPSLAAAVAAAYETVQRAGHPLIGGAADAVRATVQAGYQMGLLTNGPADIQRLKLAHTGLATCFEAVVISGEAGIGKPSPGAFQLVLDALGARPEETVMVGDSWARDVQGARAAGLGAIWIGAGRAAPEPTTEVAAVASIGELPAMLAAWTDGFVPPAGSQSEIAALVGRKVV